MLLLLNNIPKSRRNNLGQSKIKKLKIKKSKTRKLNYKKLIGGNNCDKKIIENFANRIFYKVGNFKPKILGEGAFGEGYLCRLIQNDATHPISNELYVVKVIKDSKSDSQRHKIDKEVGILKHIKTQKSVSDFTLCFRGYDKGIDKKTGESYYYILTDYAGEDYKTLEIEDLTQEILILIYKSIIGLHYIGVAHLDIKPNNILYSSVKQKIIIIDYGVSCLDNPQDINLGCKNNPYGTLIYKDLRLLTSYGKGTELNITNFMNADLWSFGIMCYKYQYGNDYHPFYRKDQIGSEHPMNILIANFENYKKDKEAFIQTLSEVSDNKLNKLEYLLIEVDKKDIFEFFNYPS